MPSSDGGAANGSWPTLFRPAGALARDRLVLLTLLALVTAGAWALTAYQATTMDMPMGIVARGAAEISDGMGDMDAMGMDDAASTTVAAHSGLS